MNFLFLTTLMILIFSLISSSMAQSLQSTAKISILLQEQTNNYYLLLNRLEKKKYYQSIKTTTKTNTKRIQSRKNKQYHPRSPCQGENSKLNLYPLTNNNYSIEEKKLLLNTLTKLIENFYQQEPFYKNTIKNNPLFIKDMIKQIQQGLYKYKSLAKIPFSNKKQREFFLNLFKGTYKSKKKSIPLINYISLNNTNNTPPLVFPSMSLPLLNAFFNPSITNKIIQKEKTLYYQGKNPSRITKKELKNILGEKNFTTHKKLLHYTPYSKKYKQTYIHTANSGITTLGSLD